MSDGQEQLAEAVRAARAAGAHHVWASMLNLRPGTREHFLAALERDWPEESTRYERLYEGRSYLPEAKAGPVRELVRSLAGEHGRERRPTLRPPAEPVQLTLI